MVTTAVLIWSTLIAAIVATFCATTVRVLREFAGHELEAYSRRKNRLNLFDEILKSETQVALAAEALQMLAIATMLVSGALWIFHLQWQAAGIELKSFLIVTVAGAVCLVVSNSWIPQVVVYYYSAPFLFHTWPIWRLIGIVAWPISFGFRLTASFFKRLTGYETDLDEEEEYLEEEIRAMVTAGERTGLLEQDAAEMIEGVIELDDTTVAQIMTPTSKVDFLNLNFGWDEMLDFVNEARRSRFPVFENKPDNVVGILVVKDLFPELAKRSADTPRSIRRFLRAPHFVPGTNTVDDLLQHFLKSRDHIAVVVDEYHNVIGVVTIEDALEEIVGEITDESDEVGEVEVERIDEFTADVLGSTHITDINEVMGCDLPTSDNYDTISGLVLHQLHDIPKEGDIVHSGRVQIAVTQASRRGISRVRLRILDEAKTP